MLDNLLERIQALEDEVEQLKERELKTKKTMLDALKSNEKLMYAVQLRDEHVDKLKRERKQQLRDYAVLEEATTSLLKASKRLDKEIHGLTENVDKLL